MATWGTLLGRAVRVQVHVHPHCRNSLTLAPPDEPQNLVHRTHGQQLQKVLQGGRRQYFCCSEADVFGYGSKKRDLDVEADISTERDVARFHEESVVELA